MMTEISLPDFTVDEFVTRKDGYIKIKDLELLEDEDSKTSYLPTAISMGIFGVSYIPFFNQSSFNEHVAILSPIFGMIPLLICALREFFPRKNLSINLKRIMGDDFDTEMVREIRNRQKTLDKGETTFIPLNLGNRQSLNKGMMWCNAKLGILVEGFDTSLTWKVYKKPSFLWDDALGNLMDIYSLRTEPENAFRWDSARQEKFNRKNEKLLSWLKDFLPGS